MYNASMSVDHYTLMGMMIIAVLAISLINVLYINDRDTNKRVENKLDTISHELGGKK